MFRVCTTNIAYKTQAGTGWLPVTDYSCIEIGIADNRLDVNHPLESRLFPS